MTHSECAGARIRVPVLVGPTAVGKTAAGIALAQRHGWEVISCDSRQIYRGMDIGTAKPTPQERGDVAHWLIDILDPREVYSAYRFATDALAVIREAAGRGRTVLICGGTGLYLKRLVEGIGPQVAMRPAFQQEYEKKRLGEGSDSIFKELASIDPETAALLHPNDTLRIIRALQVYHDTGVPLSIHKKNTHSPQDVEFVTVILTLPRQELYRRINARVDAMFGSGLWDEFRLLRQRGYQAGDAGMHCVGYQELFGVEEGLCSLEQAAETIKMNSRRYAKRQITWFTHQTAGVSVDMAQPDCLAQIECLLTRPFQDA